MSFENRVMLITGASAGIGSICAQYFAKEGALLALVGRNAEEFEKVLENIKKSGVKTEPLVILADVSVDAERIIGETIEKYGRLDVLNNNAAIGNHATIKTLQIEDFDKIFAVNVRGVVELTQYAVPHLIRSRGNIVNVSSVVSTASFQNFLIYSMSKAALDQFTKCTAMELASKVRVNSVNPGFINTDFHGFDQNSNEYAALVEANNQLHPIGRIGKPKEVVDAIAFLANENLSAFITGVLLCVDDGLGRKSAF